MRPEDILSHPARVLTRAQREAYFRDGFVVVPGAVGGEWLARLRQATEEMIERSRALTASDDAFILEEGHTAASPRLRRLTNPVIHHKTFWEFASDSLSADAAADVCGPDVKFYHAKLNFKWARGGQEFKWHQDIQAWPHTNYSPVTIGLYLDDCGPEQGPLVAIRGSHEGPLHSMYDAEGRWVLSIPEETLAWAGPDLRVPMTGPAGTLVLLNCRTVHGSMQNRSERSRPFLLNVYSSADAFPYRPNPLANRYEGTIVRGQPARWAHHDPRPCEIPPDWSAGYAGPWAHQRRATGAEDY
ncbi:MAG TPA: phytanoyl-CoA dioxygenase family protein [Vicinamibacterales bacterium]|nr:phytanoyl-CoA dioxygenase family protein [Vicinamibacterales bacterium]